MCVCVPFESYRQLTTLFGCPLPKEFPKKQYLWPHKTRQRQHRTHPAEHVHHERQAITLLRFRKYYYKKYRPAQEDTHLYIYILLCIYTVVFLATRDHNKGWFILPSPPQSMHLIYISRVGFSTSAAGRPSFLRNFLTVRTRSRFPLRTTTATKRKKERKKCRLRAGDSNLQVFPFFPSTVTLGIIS